MKKRILSIILGAAMLTTSLTACGSSDKSEDKTTAATTAVTTQAETTSVASANFNLAALKGPTAIGLAKLLTDSDAGKTTNKYNYSIYGTADEITTGLIKGSLDVAAVPANLASVLYNKTKGEVVIASINTLGVLYMVETGDSIKSVSDLKGKTIYSTGQGTTPEYTLRYILSANGIDPDKDVTIEYKYESTEVVSMLATESDAVAMLPQPYVTVAQTQNNKIRIAFSISDEWDKVNKDSKVVTGVLVARKSFINDNKDAFNSFLNEYSASCEYANTNVDETAQLVESLDIFKAAIAKKAIPFCNVKFIEGDEMKSSVKGYLSVLFDQDPKSVGGTLPDDNIFYTR